MACKSSSCCGSEIVHRQLSDKSSGGLPDANTYCQTCNAVIFSTTVHHHFGQHQRILIDDRGTRVNNLPRGITYKWNIENWIEQGLTSHSTHVRSFQRLPWSSAHHSGGLC